MNNVIILGFEFHNVEFIIEAVSVAVRAASAARLGFVTFNPSASVAMLLTVGHALDIRIYLHVKQPLFTFGAKRLTRFVPDDMSASHHRGFVVVCKAGRN